MPDIQSLARRAHDLGAKVDWWNTAIIWVLVFAALVAVGTVLSTYMAFRRAKQFADAQEELNAAKEKALSDELGVKTLQIEHLKGDTANLTAKNLQLSAIIDPRRLSDKQQKELESLTAFSGRIVELKSYSLDTEAFVLATQIGHALAKPQIKLLDNRLTMGPEGSILTGISVSGSDKALVEALRKALSPDGGELVKDLPNAVNRGISGSVKFNIVTLSIPPAATITVGVKPIK